MKVIPLSADALVIVVAPAGAGKSTFVRQHFRPTEIVSSDRCRALVADDESDQRATGPAFEVFDAIIRGRLRMGRLAVADATNLDAEPRRRLREFAREHARPVVAIVLDVPRARAEAQNLARSRRVPPHVLDLHYARFATALDALPGEGYDAIHHLRPRMPVRITRLAATLSLVLALVACRGGTGERPAAGAESRSDSAFASMQVRGASPRAMGVDQYTSAHQFEALADGGRIELQREVQDSAGVQQIRSHLAHIADAFSEGDFEIPAFVHGRAEVPGTDVMRARRDAIEYEFRPLPRGGEVRIRSHDAEAIGAIHEFLAFQRSDHRSAGHGGH